jgi:hypothetical protein
MIRRISINQRVSLDEVSEVFKFKLFERITMNHRVSLDEDVFIFFILLPLFSLPTEESISSFAVKKNI